MVQSFKMPMRLKFKMVKNLAKFVPYFAIEMDWNNVPLPMDDIIWEYLQNLIWAEVTLLVNLFILSCKDHTLLIQLPNVL